MVICHWKKIPAKPTGHNFLYNFLHLPCKSAGMVQDLSTQKFALSILRKHDASLEKGRTGVNCPVPGNLAFHPVYYSHRC